jgi:hypothetical protein
LVVKSFFPTSVRERQKQKGSTAAAKDPLLAKTSNPEARELKLSRRKKVRIPSISMKQNPESTDGEWVSGSYSLTPLLCAKAKMLSVAKRDKSKSLDAMPALHDTSPF